MTFSEKSEHRLRVLYFHSGPTPPALVPESNALWWLSRYLRGDLVTTIWFRRAAYLKGRREWESALGSFGYHAVPHRSGPGVLKSCYEGLRFVLKGLQLSRARGGFDVVISYGPFKTGVAGYVVSRLTGTPWILELPGNPNRTFAFDATWPGRIRRRIAKLLIPALVSRADHVRLLYPGQLDGLRVKRMPPASIFHEFTSVSRVAGPGPMERTILFVGYPWYLKGVDVLIRAFQLLSPTYRDWRLLVVGHCPDRRPFEELAAGNQKIEFRRGTSHAEVMALMASCGVFVLPSRTEAMGRVLLEAMAAARPVVASAVDGIPHYVEDGISGLLFAPGNHLDLAEKLERVLTDPELAGRLGRAGRERVLRAYTEAEYAIRFTQMVRTTVASRASEPRARES